MRKKDRLQQPAYSDYYCSFRVNGTPMRCRIMEETKEKAKAEIVKIYPNATAVKVLREYKKHGESII